jgi:hypothetical protein
VLVQGRPRPLQRAVDGGHARIHQRRGLGGRQAQHVSRDQHCPLPGWQQLDDRSSFVGVMLQREGMA